MPSAARARCGRSTHTIPRGTGKEFLFCPARILKKGKRRRSPGRARRGKSRESRRWVLSVRRREGREGVEPTEVSRPSPRPPGRRHPGSGRTGKMHGRSRTRASEAAFGAREPAAQRGTAPGRRWGGGPQAPFTLTWPRSRDGPAGRGPAREAAAASPARGVAPLGTVCRVATCLPALPRPERTTSERGGIRATSAALRGKAKGNASTFIDASKSTSYGARERTFRDRAPGRTKRGACGCSRSPLLSL